MAPPLTIPRPLWLGASAVAAAAGLWLLFRTPEPPLTQEALSKRIAFCATVLDATTADDKMCGPYREQAKQHRKEVAEAAEAAKPKPRNQFGWHPTDIPGIFWRWCTSPDCTTDRVIGDNGSVLMQVWCKTRRCGDIYGRVNLISDSGVVVGWTNDTGYGDYGQKVQLTFQSTDSGWSKVRLTELNIGGISAW